MAAWPPQTSRPVHKYAIPLTLAPKYQRSWSRALSPARLQPCHWTLAVWFIPSDGRIIPYLPDTAARWFLMSTAARTPKVAKLHSGLWRTNGAVGRGAGFPFSTSAALVCCLIGSTGPGQGLIDLSQTQFLQSLGLILLAQRPREMTDYYCS